MKPGSQTRIEINRELPRLNIRAAAILFRVSSDLFLNFVVASLFRAVKKPEQSPG
jgi:hypothetical protein